MSQDAGMVKKETVILIAIGALVMGFLAGIVFSVYKSPGPPPQMAGGTQGQQQGVGQQQAPSKEQLQQIFALEQAAQKDPNNADLWTNLGNAYFDTTEHDKAIAAYEKSLNIKPDNADVLTDLGVMYLESGQAAKAMENFDKAIAANPNHEQSRINKGIVLYNNLNDKKGAIEAWEGLAKINPNAKAPNGSTITEFLKSIR